MISSNWNSISDSFSFENIVNYILEESLSRTAYHFTKFMNLYNIVRNDEIRFSKVNETEKSIDSKYGYFLSTTRQKSSDIGFAYVNNCDVRITLNVDPLNDRFKAKPVSFFRT